MSTAIIDMEFRDGNALFRVIGTRHNSPIIQTDMLQMPFEQAQHLFKFLEAAHKRGIEDGLSQACGQIEHALSQMKGKP